ncbi:MAG: protein kinase [Cellulomonadaceae bacterium]|nr:protein kinase [Cellulomonadaceae bacterium]
MDGRFRPGARIGSYTVRALLGQGAMGEVYEACDDGGNVCAVKVLRHTGSDAEGRARMSREVTALQRVRTPGIAALLDAELDGEDAFLVTELVDGVTLADEVRAAGPLDAMDLYSLATQLAVTLNAVHLAGVVHRDLKPSNVMLAGRGPVLIDFGIALGGGEGSEEVALTLPGTVIGTPGYLAPELLDGHTASAGTDWWSWAAVLAFAATGRSPFGTKPWDVVMGRSREGRADVVGVPARTAQALIGALAPDPAARWAPADVVHALKRDSEEARLTSEIPVVGAAATAVLPSGHSAGSEADSQNLVMRNPAAQTLPETTAYPLAGASDGADATALLPSGLAAGAEGGPRGHSAGSGADSQNLVGQNLAPHNLEPQGFPAPPPALYTRPEPRKRRGTIAALFLPIVALGATRPGTALAVFAGLLVIARIVGCAFAAWHVRREKFGGTRDSDRAVAIAQTPWHLVRGVLGVIPQAILGLVTGVLIYTVGHWILSPGRIIVTAQPGTGTGTIPLENRPIAFVVLMAVSVAATVVVTWFGPAGHTGRRGARLILSKVAPGMVGAAVVIALSVVAALVLGRPVLDAVPVVHWWPLDGSPLGGSSLGGNSAG